jgi:hypothetical protein
MNLCLSQDLSLSGTMEKEKPALMTKAGNFHPRSRRVPLLKHEIITGTQTSKKISTLVAFGG